MQSVIALASCRPDDRWARLAAAEIGIDELEKRNRGLTELETALAKLGAAVADAERARAKLLEA